MCAKLCGMRPACQARTVSVTESERLPALRLAGLPCRLFVHLDRVAGYCRRLLGAATALSAPPAGRRVLELPRSRVTQPEQQAAGQQRGGGPGGEHAEALPRPD